MIRIIRYLSRLIGWLGKLMVLYYIALCGMNFIYFMGLLLHLFHTSASYNQCTGHNIFNLMKRHVYCQGGRCKAEGCPGRMVRSFLMILSLSLLFIDRKLNG